MNLVSFIVVVVVLALAVLALLSLTKGKGSCKEGGRSKTRDCSSCQINCPLKNSEFGIRNAE